MNSLIKMSKLTIESILLVLAIYATTYYDFPLIAECVLLMIKFAISLKLANTLLKILEGK